MVSQISQNHIKIKKPHGILLGVTLLVGAVVALLAWALSSIEGLARIFSIMTRLCQGILSQCLGYAALLRMVLLWGVGLTLLAGMVFAGTRAVFTLLKARKALKRLPLRKGENLVLIDDATIATAFTHGIIRPRIYISRGLLRNLERAELHAVFHHELSHKKNRDPLRFFLLSLFRDILFFIPLATHVYGRIKDEQEMRADDMAVAHMREPLSIAGALVKLAGTLSPPTLQTASILGAQGSVEGRIRRLLGEKAERRERGPGKGAVLASVILPAIILTSLALPIKQGMPSAHRTCTMAHCSNEKPRPEKNCRIHCDKTTRILRPTPPKPLP